MKHVYQPVGNHKDFFYCQDAEVLLAGPAGTGKSRACLEKVHALCMYFPGIRAALVRKTATSLGNTAKVTFDHHVADQAILNGELKFYYPNANNPAEYRYLNGSNISLLGMDKGSKIMSSEYDLVYVMEATELTLDDWEVITSRLRNNKMPFQQIIADCNPASPAHWLKQRSDSGKTTMFTTRHQDNPTIYQDGVLTPAGASYMDKLNNLTGVRRSRLLEGKWVSAEGVVYDEFDPSIHLISRYNSESGTGLPPADWPRYWSVDFGYIAPFVCQFWTVDQDGRLILYREIYQTQTTIEDLVPIIDAARHTKKGIDPLPVAVITDHEPGLQEILNKKLGIRCINANKDVQAGIERVKARLAIAEDGLPRLMICRDALHNTDALLLESRKPASTEEEIGEYVWDSRKETPLKVNDHGMDAMRYMVMHLDGKKANRIRIMSY